MLKSSLHESAGMRHFSIIAARIGTDQETEPDMLKSITLAFALAFSTTLSGQFPDFAQENTIAQPQVLAAFEAQLAAN
ncbi:MAG: hypothetical protein AAGF55_15805 [Pseudomonadota bacterium]